MGYERKCRTALAFVVSNGALPQDCQNTATPRAHACPNRLPSNSQIVHVSLFELPDFFLGGGRGVRRRRQIMAAPSHRHQSSLEGLIDASANAQPWFANSQERARGGSNCQSYLLGKVTRG